MDSDIYGQPEEHDFVMPTWLCVALLPLTAVVFAVAAVRDAFVFRASGAGTREDPR